MAELGFGLGDDRNIMPAGNPYMNSMQPGAQNMYGPAQMQQMPMPQMPMQQIPMQQYGARNMMPPNGNNSQVSISYISPEGITYNMGFTAPHEKRGDALYTSLCGLYGLMMTEGKMGSGKKAGGKYDGSKGYSGSSKGYSGGKGGSN
ncbi:hypothetical protein HQ545_04385 [Candidatus Woesearchaeota archaeon]|nr:hypothetical protein [Candidatus Woesearchaeota archaeon]